MRVKGTIAIERTPDGGYLYKLLDESGAEMAVSGEFETLPACRSGVAALRGCIDSEQVEADGEGHVDGVSYYDVFEDGGAFSFLLKGFFGEILLTGPRCADKLSCLALIEALRALELEPQTLFLDDTTF